MGTRGGETQETERESLTLMGLSRDERMTQTRCQIRSELIID